MFSIMTISLKNVSYSSTADFEINKDDGLSMATI